MELKKKDKNKRFNGLLYSVPKSSKYDSVKPKLLSDVLGCAH